MITIPGPQLPRLGTAAGIPSGIPTGAPMMMQSQAAAHAMNGGIAGCPNGCEQTLKDIAPGLWDRIPLWAKVLGGVVLVGGFGLVVYKMTR